MRYGTKEILIPQSGIFLRIPLGNNPPVSLHSEIPQTAAVAAGSLIVWRLQGRGWTLADIIAGILLEFD